MRHLSSLGLATLAAAFLSGCATWSTSNVDSSGADVKVTTEQSQKKNSSDVLLTDGDMPGRKYASVGDVTVTVNKTTIFHPDPTREMVNEKLREKGAELGADAVIFVRYGNGGISFVSWGSLEGKGRAIKFLQ